MRIEPHECLAEFDPLSPEEREALKKSLKKNGCRVPLLIWKPKEWLNDTFKLMDGRHRFDLCNELGITYNVTVMDGTEKEAVALARSLNEDRRHRPHGVRAMAAADEATAQEGRPKITGAKEPVSAAEAAKHQGVSVGEVKRAKKVRKKGTKKLQQAVLDETITVGDAAKVADEPPKAQDEAVQDVKKGKAKTATEAVKSKRLCDQCKEIGVQENCPVCEHLRTHKAHKDIPDHYEDDAGTTAPSRLNKVFAAVALYKLAEKQLNACAKTFKLIEESPAKEAKPLDKQLHFEKFFGPFKNARRRVQMMRPALVCAKCEGEGCKECQDKGWWTVEEKEAQGVPA